MSVSDLKDTDYLFVKATLNRCFFKQIKIFQEMTHF